MRLDVSIRKSFNQFSLETAFSVDALRLGVFGESGSGKSTLVGILAGLISPCEGVVSLDGEQLFSSTARINLPPERRRIAVVFQHPHLFPHLTVRGNLLYGYRRTHPGCRRRINFDSLVDVLKLGPLLERNVKSLSGGEQQRVAIGRAVLSHPRLLIMDEPLSALDDDLKFQIIPYLRTVCDAFSIPFLFISHSLMEMRLMVDTVLVYEKGRLSQTTTPEDLARSRMETSPVGYINMVRPKAAREDDGLMIYRWGNIDLIISARSVAAEPVFELSSKDIILFKKHPEVISARNLLCCTIRRTFPAGAKVGVELSCGGEILVAEVVKQAADDLQMREGTEIFAAIKASAFRRLI